MALSGLIAMAFSILFFADSRYGSAEQQQVTQQRLEYKIFSDTYYVIQQRIWALKDRLDKTHDGNTEKQGYKDTG